MVYLHSYLNFKDVNELVDGKHFAFTSDEIKDANKRAVRRYKKRVLDNSKEKLEKMLMNAPADAKMDYFAILSFIRETLEESDRGE